MNEGQPENPTPLLSEITQQIIKKQLRSNPFARGSQEEKQIAAEVGILFNRREYAADLLKALFPNGIPTSIEFYDILNNFQRLGWNDSTHRLTGLFLLLAVEQLPEKSGEALLDEIHHIKDSRFFETLGSLAVLMAEKQLRFEFIAKWLPSLVRRIGQDLAAGDFWKAIQTYCERHACTRNISSSVFWSN